MEDSLVKELSDEVRDALFRIVKELLGTDDFKIHTNAGSKKGDNFVGICYRMNFSAADDSNASSLFLKMAPTDGMVRAMLNIRLCFMREIYTYDVILPYFREFQESRGVQDGFYEFPKCYKSISREINECIFLQDMANQDFMMIDKAEVTVDHILLVMKALGKFHAVSFALRDQEPEKLAGIISELTEFVYIRGKASSLTNPVNNAAINAINCITDDADANLVKVLMDLYETNQYDLMADLSDGNGAEPYAVIIHGDIWSNNTMFKYNENNTLEDICIIDWQIARYGSPVLDLMYYLFSSTTRELRGRNYNVYLKTYHESLSNLLLRLGSDPEKLFPYSAFQEQLLKYGKFGILNATFALPIQISEMSFSGNPNGVGELSDEFKKRFRDIAADSYRLGYI